MLYIRFWMGVSVAYFYMSGRRQSEKNIMFVPKMRLPLSNVFENQALHFHNFLRILKILLV